MLKSVKKTKISGESLIPGGFCVNVTNQHSPASLPRRSASTSLLFINQPKNKQKTNKKQPKNKQKTNQKTNKKQPKPTKKTNKTRKDFSIDPMSQCHKTGQIQAQQHK